MFLGDKGACPEGRARERLAVGTVTTAVSDRTAAPHGATFFDMDSKYAHVMSLPDVLDQLQRTGVGRGHR